MSTHENEPRDDASKLQQIGADAYSSIVDLVEDIGDACPYCEGGGDFPDTERLVEGASVPVLLTDEAQEKLRETYRKDFSDWVQVRDHLDSEGWDMEHCPICDGSGERDEDAREQGRERILEDALSVEVRSDWYTLDSDSDRSPGEYMILLSTGGPATRIIGKLDRYCEPETARLEAQDWFQPWTEYRGADQDVLLAYARCFYYGEGS
jgi:hypothetical protein